MCISHYATFTLIKEKKNLKNGCHLKSWEYRRLASEWVWWKVNGLEDRTQGHPQAERWGGAKRFWKWPEEQQPSPPTSPPHKLTPRLLQIPYSQVQWNNYSKTRSRSCSQESCVRIKSCGFTGSPGSGESMNWGSWASLVVVSVSVSKHRLLGALEHGHTLRDLREDEGAWEERN